MDTCCLIIKLQALLQKEKSQNFYIREDLTACLIKIDKNENLSDAEKSQLKQSMQNLTDALNNQNTSGPRKNPIENSENFPTESVSELHSELGKTSVKVRFKVYRAY